MIRSISYKKNNGTLIRKGSVRNTLQTAQFATMFTTFFTAMILRTVLP